MQASSIITREKLATIGSDVLHQTGASSSENPADYTVHRLKEVLQKNYGVNATEAYAPINGKNHTVVMVPAEDVNHKSNEGYFIVDPAIGFFEDEINTRSISVAVLSPEDERKYNWYDMPPQ